MGLAAIVLSGRLERHPGIRVIGASGGGALALLARRLDLAWKPRHWDASPGRPEPGTPGLHVSPRTTAPPSELVRDLYVDTTVEGAMATAMAIDVLGADHVLFGTDSPPLPVALDSALQSFAGLSDADRNAVLGGNAARLFNLT